MHRKAARRELIVPHKRDERYIHGDALGRIAAMWYALVVFATAMVGSAFHRIRRWIDRIAAVAIMGFGAKLALDR
jgi:threonine/homoserine/homoserine lactone efflux protein